MESIINASLTIMSLMLLEHFKSWGSKCLNFQSLFVWAKGIYIWEVTLHVSLYQCLNRGLEKSSMIYLHCTQLTGKFTTKEWGRSSQSLVFTMFYITPSGEWELHNFSQSVLIIYWAVPNLMETWTYLAYIMQKYIFIAEKLACSFCLFMSVRIWQVKDE